MTYDADVPSENVLRLCYNAETGQPEPAALLHLPTAGLRDGAPVGWGDRAAIALPPILAAGQAEIEARIAADLPGFAAQLAEPLGKERAALQVYYEAELAALAPHEVERRRQLKQRVDKLALDLDRKYTWRVRVQLLSMLQVWWPVARYTLTLPGQRKTLSLSDIVYDARVGHATYRACPVCGNQTQFDLCVVGQHAACGGACHHDLLICSVCGDSMCAEHGGACPVCARPVCVDDGERCAYGEHAVGSLVCPDCRVVSFEGKPLCADCLEVCASCRRPFAHQHLTVCRVGGERLCEVKGAAPCAQRCQYCGEPTCTEHGRLTVDGAWACRDHVTTTTCCHGLYSLAQVKPCCVNAAEALCPLHRFMCRACGQAVCEAHSSPLRLHRGQRVCATHRAVCALCDPAYSYLAADLDRCVACARSVCATHRVRCAVCRQSVCAEHAQRSASGETLCPAHAGECHLCPPTARVHRATALETCARCGAKTCAEHHFTCEVCGQTTLCVSHRPQLAGCAGCGRVSCGLGRCSAGTQSCRDCGVTYCPQCMRGADTTTCPTCRHLAADAFVPASEQYVSYLQQLRPVLIGEAATTVDAFLAASAHLSLKHARNKQYHMLVYRCRSPLMQRVFRFDFSTARKSPGRQPPGATVQAVSAMGMRAAP